MLSLPAEILPFFCINPPAMHALATTCRDIHARIPRRFFTYKYHRGVSFEFIGTDVYGGAPSTRVYICGNQLSDTQLEYNGFQEYAITHLPPYRLEFTIVTTSDTVGMPVFAHWGELCNLAQFVPGYDVTWYELYSVGVDVPGMCRAVQRLRDSRECTVTYVQTGAIFSPNDFIYLLRRWPHRRGVIYKKIPPPLVHL